MSQAVQHDTIPRRIRVLLGMLVLCCASAASALTVQVLGAGVGSESFVTALASRLGESHRVLTEANGETADIVIVLHEGVLPAARALHKPLLLLLPTPDSVALQENETAVYWAPSLTDQLRLARRIMPGLRRVGLVAGSQDSARVQALRAALASQHIELIARQADAGLLVRQVAEVAASADLLLAPADTRLYNRDNLKAVLLAAYRQNRIFIGPNPAYVHAGSLASLYASPETLAADTAEFISSYLREGHWSAPVHASRFDVITNPQVARALGLRLPDTAVLTHAIQAEEVTPWP